MSDEIQIGPPRVGAVLPDNDGGCSYVPSEDGERCTASAVWHLLIFDAGYGTVGLGACEEHVPIALASGQVLGKHAHDVGCELQDARWFPDRCRIGLEYEVLS
jgi:hypothetical protein